MTGAYGVLGASSGGSEGFETRGGPELERRDWHLLGVRLTEKPHGLTLSDGLGLDDLGSFVDSGSQAPQVGFRGTERSRALAPRLVFGFSIGSF